MKKGRLGLLMLFYSICIVLPLQAQSSKEFEEFVRQRRQEFAKFKEDREVEFNRYREQYNREFAEYLRNSWRQVDPEDEVLPPPQPKPFVPKQEDDEVKPHLEVPEELPIDEIVKPLPVPNAPKPIIIDQPKDELEQNIIYLKSFFGNDFRLRCSENFSVSLSECTPSAISTAWGILSSKDTDLLVYDCQQVRIQYNYCDWMFYLFVKAVAHVVTQTPDDSNEEVILTGYILAQSGIDFRFAYLGNRLYLALPFETDIYGCTYFHLDGKKFYVIEKDLNTACYLMDRSFSREAVELTLRITTPMRLSNSQRKTIVLSSKKYPELSVELSSSQSLMSFYHGYPRMDWQEYAMAPLEKKTEEYIRAAFTPVLSGKSEVEQANMLLDFVQSAFTYGYDDQIWGGDRPFFADETLNYPQSDCEDRSILFSHLIRLLTDMDVVLLHYPNHLATAVRFSQDMQGDYVSVNGEKYLVCDPTGYKPVGNAYDEFKNVQAKVIRIR